MPTLCCACAGAIVRSQGDSISCTSCSGIYHRDCVGIGVITQEELQNWKCGECGSRDRLESIISSFDDMKADVEKLKGLQNETKKSIDKVLKNLSSVSELSSQLKSNTASITRLKQSVELLKNKQHRLESILKRRELVITGVPETESDVKKVVFNICKLFGIAETTVNLDNCFRFKSPTSKVNPILVVFSGAKQRDDLLMAYRRRKKPIKATELGLTVDAPIRIGEHTSSEQKNLMIVAREKLIKNGNFKFLWFSDNQVLIKEKEGAKVMCISSLEDIDRIKKTCINPLDTLD